MYIKKQQKTLSLSEMESSKRTVQLRLVRRSANTVNVRVELGDSLCPQNGERVNEVHFYYMTTDGRFGQVVMNFKHLEPERSFEGKILATQKYFTITDLAYTTTSNVTNFAIHGAVKCATYEFTVARRISLDNIIQLNE